MNIYKVSPRGYCSGVVEALKIVKDTITQFPNQKIYMLGLFVHNPVMIKEFDNKVVILDDTTISRYKLVEGLPIANNNEILILSAHGTDLKTIYLAINKGYKVINTTCKYVHQTHDAIKESITKNHHIIFIGKKNHPETNAIISNNPSIHFVENYNDILNINIKDLSPVDVYNQTTLSIFDIKHLHDEILSKFKNVNIYNEICDATTQRQLALYNFDKKVDIFFVIGYKKSSNSNELYKIAKKRFNNAFLINSIEEINLEWLKGVENIGITSGTSTPTELTNKIIKFLEEF